MFNWLGTWLGGWFGSGDPAPPGSMSGVALVSVSTAATLTSTGSAPGMMSGTAALAISTTATITHATPVTTGNFWADGFWSAGFWADGFWGVFEQPYTELKPNLKLFVRTELHKLFVHSDVEQIIAVAEANNLSVLRAASALSMAVRVEGSRMTARIESRIAASTPRAPQPASVMAPRAALSVVVPRENLVSVRANNPRAVYVTETAHDGITVLLPANAAFVLQKPNPGVVVTTRAKTTAATGGV